MRRRRAAVCAVVAGVIALGAGAGRPAQIKTPAPNGIVEPAAAAGTTAQQTEFTRAKTAMQEILARPEFQPPQKTWWERLKERLRDWLVRLFLGVDRMTTESPWVGRLLMWLLFMGAAAGLLVWLLRTVRRQQLRVAVGVAERAAAWTRETEEWQRVAEELAARSKWREAIHALYWAAIVGLERQRAWRHNPARTPREYVQLLKAGSLEQRELRELTRALERTWYGQREARAEEYGEARQSFERLAAGAERLAAGAERLSPSELAGGRL